MNRYLRGEPLDYDPELDQGDEDLDDQGDDRPEFELGQAWRDFVAMGRIGLALSQPAKRPEPGVIDMVEVAPGVYARKRNPSPARGGPLGRIERIQRAFARLEKEFR